MSSMVYRGSKFLMSHRMLFQALLILVASFAISPVIPSALGLYIPVNPRATYLRTNQDSGAISVTPIELFRYGIDPYDRLHLARIGFYKRGNEYSESSIDLVGVFSSSATLLGSQNQRRVVDAIDAGVDVDTVPTYAGDLSTFITQDFAIGPRFVDITVPMGAGYLFVSPNDSYFSDNSDPDGDFQLSIQLIRYVEPKIQVPESGGLEPHRPVPEPQFAFVALLGLLILSGIRRRPANQ